MSELSSGQQICGRYTLLAKLGSGGHGEVWRAVERNAGGEIAVKVLYPAVAALQGAFASLEREYRISCRLPFPGILRVYPPVAARDAMLLPMEIAPGGDLRRLRGADSLQVVPLLIELARALEAAHAHGVVHRDLKPGNVLLDGAGHVKLADFGVAALDGDSPPRRIGSPFNSSPQQILGQPPTPADDMYGFGALAYELLCGIPPFYPHFDPQRVLRDAVPELHAVHECPIRLTTLVMRMLAKRPSDRPPSMTAVIEALEDSLTDTLPFELAGGADAPPADRRVSDDTPPPSRDAARVLPDDVPHDRSGDLRGDLPGEPRFAWIEPMPARRWRYGVLAGALLAGAALLVILTRLGPESRQALEATLQPAPAAMRERIAPLRQHFERRLAELAHRDADLWGGAAFRAARGAGRSASAAFDRGDLGIAESLWQAGTRDLAEVAAQAPTAFTAQLEAGDRALAVGDTAAAAKAYSVARRIEPGDARALARLEHARSLGASANDTRGDAAAPASRRASRDRPG